jgi:hypothetical protein
MFLSIIYWFFAMGMDILLVASPTTVSSCLQNMTDAGALLEARRRSGLRGKAGKDGDGKGSKRGGLRSADEDPNFVSFSTNQLSVAGGDGSRMRVSISDSELAGMETAPDEATWRAMRASFVANAEKARTLQAEVQLLRDQVAEQGGDDAAAAVPKKAKKYFAPSQVSDGAKTESASAKLLGSVQRSRGAVSS